MSDDEDAPVGYGRPPKQHRIKSREVRNPWGRRGKPRPEIDFLDEPFDLKTEGRVVKITRGQALDWALFKKAVEGSVPAVRELERRGREREASRAGTGDASLLPEEARAFARCVDRKVKETAARSVGANHPSQSDPKSVEGSG